VVDVMRANQGFTLFELLVGLAIIGILVAIGLPKLNDFTAKLRVDEQISQLNRLVLTARNTAINSGKSVTLCPHDGSISSSCNTNWNSKISVFIDTDTNLKPDDSNAIVKVKEAIRAQDTLTFAASALTFGPDGRIKGNGGNIFIYCPNGDNKLARGLMISVTGQAYATSDIDNDGKDEDRNNNELSCE
jgi:prepilin-type N-terminal cleavage/methylation domain-containing protein